MLVLKSKFFKVFAGREMRGSVRVDQVSQAQSNLCHSQKHAEAEF